MTRDASPFMQRPVGETSLSSVQAALASHDELPLHIDYLGRRAQPGYHVTEVKAGSFVTLDCGSNADAWQETILQVEDIPAEPDGRQMTVRTFRSILMQVDRKVRLNGEARLTFEIGLADEPMAVFDVAGISITPDGAVLQLGPRPAICKPRHRAALAGASQCCPPNGVPGCC